MSMTLNPVNEAAFQKAVQSLETLNRAAVFHPTGTGKSCIAWKVVEAHPQTTFFWLVAGAQRLALRQAELTRYNGGTLPGNVRFCDCEKLAAATPEQWVRLGEQKPGCIVLDCYHELSAVCWAQSVQKLLRMCPQAKVLGLGVPNGAPVCAAAQELFADCIVSHMTVAEAMAAGTMPVPSAYAALLWPQEEELATLRARIKNLCMPKGDTSLRVQYEELSWSLRQVENLTVLLPRLLSDTSGHYLVLFESAAYQEKLGVELEQLLRTVDPAVRFYAADHACFADSAAVETFLSDTAPGPKVLLCVNAPGVQQPLEGLAGVILALGLAAGSPSGLVQRLYLADISWQGILLVSAGFYLALRFFMGQAARHGGGELLQVTISVGGRTQTVTALHDTGNTLRDPVSGCPALVLERQAADGLWSWCRAVTTETSRPGCSPAAWGSPSADSSRLRTGTTWCPSSCAAASSHCCLSGRWGRRRGCCWRRAATT